MCKLNSRLLNFLIFFLTIIILFDFSVQAKQPPKNIIFYIGDGMGITQILAARISLLGANNRFHMEKLPVTGLITTHAIDNLITDSAAGSTAMATGFKTRNGMVGVAPDSLPLITILEAAALKGITTGLIATSSITHATPACFASHVVSRKNQAEIASQLIQSNVQLMMGGGRAFFLPGNHQGSERSDSRNLLEEAKKRGYQFIMTASEMSTLNSPKVLGLFAMNAMGNDSAEPTLAQMTQKAIEILSSESSGFFLVIEGSQIDWAGHDNDFQHMVREMKAFDDAVKTGLDFARGNENTLVVVTADHETGGLLLTGGNIDGTDIQTEWTTKYHTGQMVPVFASGKGAWMFSGVNDNTIFAKNFARFLEIHDFPALHISNR